MKIIGVDGRALTAKPAGVANFLIAALNNLPRLMSDFTFIVFVHELVDDEVDIRLKKHNNCHIIITPFLIFPHTGIIWFQFKLPFILKKYGIQYFWGPAQVLPFFISSSVKTILTIHDVVFLKFPRTMSLPTLIESLIWTRWSIKNADIVWTVSNYTKKEVELAFPVRKCANFVVGSYIDHDAYKRFKLPDIDDESIIKKYSINHPFILFVGTLEPRKNLSFLLRLMPSLAQKGISLLVAGGKGWKQNQIISDIVNTSEFPIDKVVFAGYIPTSDLVYLYNIADLLVSVSLDEGFGLPLIEALACGCPVLCPDNSGMSEIIENNIVKLQNWNEANWGITIQNLVYNKQEVLLSNFLNNRWVDIALTISKVLI